MVYDVDFKYGQNFYLCTTEECKERVLHVSNYFTESLLYIIGLNLVYDKES